MTSLQLRNYYEWSMRMLGWAQNKIHATWSHDDSGVTSNKMSPERQYCAENVPALNKHLSLQSQVVRCPLMDGVKCGWQSGDDKVVNCKSTKFASMEADPKGATECTGCIKITSPVCKHRDIWDYHQSGNIRVSVQSAEEALTQSVLLDRGGAWKRAGCLSESQYLQHNTTQRHVQSKPNRKWIVMC